VGRFAGLARGLQGPAEQLRALALAAGLNPKVTSVKRSTATQRRLYDAYIHGRSIYPAAKPGTSKHERGLAFDMVLNVPRDHPAYRQLGEIWEKAGGRWGGRFKDEIHFEL
jgi:LAS superfamily LD-carboxypeptidase LdcB